MKTNTYLLFNVTYEWCIGLCHKDYLKMKTIGTSCNVSIHIHRDTSPFMIMSTDAYAIMIMMMMIIPRMTPRGLLTSGQLTRLWWVQGGANYLGIYNHTCGSCVEKYYTSNFCPDWKSPIWLFLNDRSLHHELHVFAFPNPNSGATYWVFLKILKPCATAFSGKGKASHTAYDDIAIRDHDTCIR